MRLGVLALLACVVSCSETPKDAPAEDAGDASADDASLANLCGPDGKPTVSYPKGSTGYGVGRVIPNATYAAESSSWSLAQAFNPCATDVRLLVLRITAAWCGTCRWHASHTQEWLTKHPEVSLVEVIHRDDQNAPATVSAIKPWSLVLDAKVTTVVAPDFPVRDAMAIVGPLPFYVVVDPKTMNVVRAFSNPSPETLSYELERSLARVRKVTEPVEPTVPLIDDRFTRDQWDLISAMALPGAPPADTTNAHADDPEAAALGAAFFSDVDLSPKRAACSTCHDPGLEFTDAKQTSATADGLGRVDRNSPSVRFASHSRFQFWDGRADSLWAQALGPPESTLEMASSRLYIAHQIAKKYGASYEVVFGALPKLDDATRFPASGKPGEVSYDSMAAADRDAVTRVYVNFGKSIAAFERTLRATPSALDRYLAGDKTALTDTEKQGLEQFLVGGCAQCHYGPRLTDDAFHALRFATGRVDGQPDRGRIDALGALATGEFLTSGSYSDDPSQKVPIPVAHDALLGAFKTPALRNVSATGPYGHGGTLTTLAEVVREYGGGGLKPEDTAAVGEREPWVQQFAPVHDAAIVAFLQALGRR